MEKGKADWYSKTWYNKDKSAVYHLTGELILNWLEKEDVNNLLDIGCGYGILTRFLSKKSDLNITAIDYDKSALIKSKEVLEDTSVKVENQNVLNMDYEDNSFDVAISTGYTSAATLPGAIKEVKRVVKPGGIIILDYLRFYNLYYLFSGNLFQRFRRYTSEKDPDQYYFGKLGLRKYLEKENGFKIEEIKTLYTYPPFIKNNKNKILFEKTIGFLLKPFLARVLILKLRNTK
jgi:ubiquinone/menaquinone biosynthesis C-methylase UbiE